jgi:predicted DNA-binding transcriptional regulator YafY
VRADRLVSLLLLLQARGRVTAGEAAAELEVSVPTVRRDLEALSAAGVPVYAQPGRGGGWSLVGGARTDLSGLTAPEVQALFLLVGPGADVSPAVRTAVRKLVRALPAPFRAEAEAAGSAVVVDQRRWGSAPRARPAHLEELRAAVVGRRRVRLAYADHAGRRSERDVEPLGLVDHHDAWFLLAGTADGRRTFRVDRVSGVDVLEDRFALPEDFDLARAWEEVSARVERARSAAEATVTVPDDLAGRFGEHVGAAYVDVLGPVPDAPGRTRLRVRADTATMIARQVAGWADLVVGEEPAEVRAELARLGAALAGYGA